MFLLNVLYLDLVHQNTILEGHLEDNFNYNLIFMNHVFTALITLGIKDINDSPEGVEDDRISHETFKREA